MNVTLLATVCLVGAGAALAQGTVNFANKLVPSGTLALASDADGTLLGSGFWAQLYAGPDADSLSAVGSPVPFRNHTTTGAGTGVVEGGAVTIPNISPGGAATVQMRAWDAAGGAVATYEAAVAAGRHYGASEILRLAATGNPARHPPTIPSDLVGLKSFTLVPEPSTLVLGAFGVAALLLRRRSWPASSHARRNGPLPKDSKRPRIDTDTTFQSPQCPSPKPAGMPALPGR